MFSEFRKYSSLLKGFCGSKEFENHSSSASISLCSLKENALQLGSAILEAISTENY
jgi:hypothetical protein